MKRKRGSKTGFKKGKKKDLASVNNQAPLHLNVDEDLSLDDNDDIPDNSRDESELPSIASDEKGKLANSDPVAKETTASKSKYGRVKVKLKSSRLLISSNTHGDSQTSETEKSNLHVASPLTDSLVEKKEGSNYSDGQSSDLQLTAFAKSPRKAGSIKIISSRGLGTSNVPMAGKGMYKVNSSLPMIGGREPGISDNERTAESSVPRKLRQKEIKSPYMDPCYNESELTAALMVVKKIMKMDAAEPFNAPVDPVALGIPDYFDIIENPMDFGTICKYLEHGQKYLNSKDVYTDVQCIWENCYRYNNKGDYVVDLMKRVKRNFMKYWTAAGLYTDLPGAIESSQMDDTAQPGNQKLHMKVKGKSLKHKRKRHGIDLHKNGCLCAVCVVRRRRKEREGTTDRHGLVFDDNIIEEKSSPAENVGSEHTSSSSDQSPEAGLTGEAEEVEHEGNLASPGQLDSARSVKQETSENEGPQAASDDGKLCGHLVEDEVQMEGATDSAVPLDDQKGEQKVQLHPEAEDQRAGPPENKWVSVYEDPTRQENAAVLRICHTLFTKDPRSVWRGPHSLYRRRPGVARSNPLRDALSTFMKR